MRSAFKKLESRDIEKFLEIEPLLIRARDEQWPEGSLEWMPAPHRSWFLRNCGAIDSVMNSFDPVCTRFDDREHFPLSPTQRDSLRILGAHPETSEFLTDNISSQIQLSGFVDSVRLERAIRSTLAECISLGATLVNDASGRYQRFCCGGVAIERNDEVGAEGKLDIRAFLRQKLANRFNVLSGGSLARVNVIRLGERELIVQFVVSHFVTDGPSEDLVQRSFMNNYISGKRSSDSAIAHKQAAYVTWLALDNEPLVQLRRAIALARLKKSAMLTGLTPYPWRKTGTSQAASLEDLYLKRTDSRNFSRQKTSKLMSDVRSSCVSLGVFPYAIVISAILCMLRRLAASDDVAVILVDNGRWYPDLYDLCGPFSAAIPISTTIDAHQSGFQLMQQVQQLVMARKNEPPLSSSSIIPMLALVVNIQFHRHEPYSATARYDCFGELISIDNSHNADVRFSSIQLFGSDEIGTTSSVCDLLFIVQNSLDGIGVNWSYQASLFTEEYIYEMDRLFACIIDRLLSDPQDTVEKISDGRVPFYGTPASL